MAGQHGFARTLPWSVKAAGSEIVCEMEDNEHTRSLWPYKFKLTYTVRLDGDKLVTELHVLNADKKPFQFTALLHTYFRVSDIDTVQVTGLKGLEYADKLQGGAIQREDHDILAISQETDRNYISFPHSANMKHGNGEVGVATTEGLPDLVVWNPWVEKARALADFGDEEYREMICLEAGKIITPQELKPSETWTGSQTICAYL